MTETALVLGGGGARGAWQAGALAWIAQNGAPSSGLGLDHLVGSSVGAINAAFLGGEAPDFDRASRALWALWSSTEVGDVYRLRLRRLWRVPRALLQGGGRPRGPVALLDNRPLEGMLRRRVRWGALGRAVSDGTLRSVAFVATDLARSATTIFAGGRALGGVNPGARRLIPAALGPEHVLASVALPLLFPPVQIDRRWYLDGGVSEQTPVRTALALGARRVLALSLDCPPAPSLDPNAPPTWPRVIGQTMNAVLTDRNQPELDRIERVNRLLDWGVAAYGPGFEAGLSSALADDREGPWERSQALLLRPSRDLGEVAGESLDRGLQGRVSDLTRVVFRFLEDTAGAGDADALSYLLFDPGYLKTLLELGWSDAEARGDELRAFLAGAQ